MLNSAPQVDIHGFNEQEQPNSLTHSVVHLEKF
jgi:hypothetical protein